MARVHERHRGRCRRDGGEERPGGGADVGEDQREQRREQQRPRGGRREGEGRVRASVAGRQPQQGELHDGGRHPGPAGAEEGQPGLVGEQKGQRHQHRGRVQHHRGRADAGQPRDDRDRGMPEREGVPRMQPAVPELVDRPQRERVEAQQLLFPGQVEEGVAVVAGDPPERDSGHHAESEHSQAPRRDSSRTGRREGRRDHRHDDQQPERQPERRVQGEHDRGRAEERAHAPRKGRREPAETERPRHQRARQEQARDRGGETKPQPEPVRGQQPREGEQRRRRQPRERKARGEAQSEAGGDGAHRLSRRATWTSAGLRSSRAKTASTYGGRCGAGRSPGRSVIAQRRRRPFIDTGAGRSPVRSW